MVKRLNVERWGGYIVGDPHGLPFVIERFPDIVRRPTFGTQGRIVYIDSQDVIYLDIGTGWVALAAEGTIDWANIQNKPSEFPPEDHSAAKITTDILAQGRGGLGKALDLTGLDDGFTIYYDEANDKFIVSAPAGGGVAWGDITGTLANQSDLDSVLDGKAADPHGSAAHTGSVIPAANQNFQKYQALAFRAENLAGLPAAGNEGRIAQNTNDHKMYYDNGSAWVAW